MELDLANGLIIGLGIRTGQNESYRSMSLFNSSYFDEVERN